MNVPSHRYIKTENIRAGDVILEEKPWVWSFVPSIPDITGEGASKLACNYCFQKPSDEYSDQKIKLLCCSACKSAFYCSKKCQCADWHARHKHGDCRNLKALRLAFEKTAMGFSDNNLQQGAKDYNMLVRRLLISTASARLHAETSNSTFRQLFFDIPLKNVDWIDFGDRATSARYSLCVSDEIDQLITISDDEAILKRIMLSFVQLCDFEPWKVALRDDSKMMRDVLDVPPQIGLAACLEMSRFPNSCNPNAVAINDGGLIRMIALENIPNLEDVRLTRLQVWKNQPRVQRRSWIFRGIYGYDCSCQRCNAGDGGDDETSDGPTMFALRCPKWAERHAGKANPDRNDGVACSGIVSGLRRSDTADSHEFDTFNRRYGADYAETIDNPNPISENIRKIPACQRAVCEKCHAKYDRSSMEQKILPRLKFMDSLNRHPWVSLRSSAEREQSRLILLKNVRLAEQYVHPDNYAFMLAKHKLMNRTLLAIKSLPLPRMRPGSHATPRLDAPTVAWMKRYATEIFDRVVGDMRAVDILQLYEIDLYRTFFAFSMNAFLFQNRFADNGSAAALDAQQQLLNTTSIGGLEKETKDLIVLSAQVATEKLKVILQMPSQISAETLFHENNSEGLNQAVKLLNVAMQKTLAR